MAISYADLPTGTGSWNTGSNTVATIVQPVAFGSISKVQALAVTGTSGGERRLQLRADPSPSATESMELEILPSPSNSASGMNSQILLMGKVGPSYERFGISEINHETVIDSTADVDGAIRPIVINVGGYSGQVGNSGKPRAGATAAIVVADASLRLRGNAATVPESGSEYGGTYGTERTTIADFENVGDSRLIIDTRTNSPASNAGDSSSVEYRRGGSRKWAVGLNFAGSNVDSFDFVNATISNVLKISQSGRVDVVSDIYKNGTAYNNPDYVFKKAYGVATNARVDYQFRPLGEVEQYTREHYHLAGISPEPSGIFARSDMLLEKLEELYLHAFEHERRLAELERENKLLRDQLRLIWPTTLSPGWNELISAGVQRAETVTAFG